MPRVAGNLDETDSENQESHIEFSNPVIDDVFVFGNRRLNDSDDTFKEDFEEENLSHLNVTNDMKIPVL